jgi:cation transport regulator ChaC
VLLLLPSEARGVDTRFRKDALVIIASEVGSYHELQQMIGRSSRQRGVCEGILYTVGEESAV